MPGNLSRRSGWGDQPAPPPPIERLPAAGTPDPKPASKEAGMEEVMDAITLGD